MTLYDDSDPIMAGLQQLDRDGYATDAQRSVARLALAEIERLRMNQRPNFNTEELLAEILDLDRAGYDDSTLLSVLNKRLRGEK